MNAKTSKRIFSLVLMLCLTISCFVGFGTTYASADGTAIEGEDHDGTSSWDYTFSCSKDSISEAAEPTFELTFSEDGTKIVKAKFSGYFTNTDTGNPSHMINWHGAGFGIDETGETYRYRYLYKNRNEITAYDTTAELWLDDAYICYTFTSNNTYDYNTAHESLTFYPGEGPNELTFEYTFTDEDNAKLDPNKTYYVNFFTQGWVDAGSEWGTIAKKAFSLSENASFRYSVNFNFNGNGTNFTLPVEKDNTVTASATNTNSDYSTWTTETKTAVDNWQASVLNPTKEGYTFGGWYTDEALTQKADFTSAVTENVTYYAKWTAVETDTKAEETTDKKPETDAGDKTESKGLSTGGIIGIVVGGVVLVLACLYTLGYVFLYRTNKLDGKKIEVIYSFLPKG